MEHSLVSISKWESKWKEPFLEIDKLTDDRLNDYIRCMTITQNVDPVIFEYLDAVSKHKIIEYIEDPMTATTIRTVASRNQNGSRKSELVTSELIYYWMITKGIPMECQKWHINRLLTLINVYNIKESSGNTMSKADAAKYQREENLRRRRTLNSKG